jgi:guanine deaminase
MKGIDQHQKFMQIAIRLAEQNVKNAIGGPFGAIVVKDGKVISKSTNKVTLKKDPTAHAEISAIRIACRKLDTFSLQGCVIYTSCEPCPMCLSAIYWAHLDKIFYANTKEDAAKIGFDDQFIYNEIALPYEKRKLPFHQIMRKEALNSFKLWNESEMKINY